MRRKGQAIPTAMINPRTDRSDYRYPTFPAWLNVGGVKPSSPSYKWTL